MVIWVTPDPFSRDCLRLTQLTTRQGLFSLQNIWPSRTVLELRNFLYTFEKRAKSQAAEGKRISPTQLLYYDKTVHNGPPELQKRTTRRISTNNPILRWMPLEQTECLSESRITDLQILVRSKYNGMNTLKTLETWQKLIGKTRSIYQMATHGFPTNL